MKFAIEAVKGGWAEKYQVGFQEGVEVPMTKAAAKVNVGQPAE